MEDGNKTNRNINCFKGKLNMKQLQQQNQESKKNHLVERLLDLGIFKINGKQLYQATLQELVQAYQQYALKPVHV